MYAYVHVLTIHTNMTNVWQVIYHGQPETVNKGPAIDVSNSQKILPDQ